MKLKIWNGRSIGCWKHGAPEWAGARRSYDGHVYACAYSLADLLRMVNDEYGARLSASEVRNYWSSNCWGDRMKGITPHRGLWRTIDHSNEPPLLIHDGRTHDPVD